MADKYWIENAIIWFSQLDLKLEVSQARLLDADVYDIKNTAKFME